MLFRSAALTHECQQVQKDLEQVNKEVEELRKILVNRSMELSTLVLARAKKLSPDTP